MPIASEFLVIISDIYDANESHFNLTTYDYKYQSIHYILLALLSFVKIL